MRKNYRIITSNHKELILKMYNEGESTINIAKKLGLGRTAVGRYLNKQGLKSNGTIKVTTQDKELMKKLYTEGKTIQYIHQEYFLDKLSEGGVNYTLRKMGITRRNGKQVTINHNYFTNVTTEEQAYWLGFITADGSVRHHKEAGESYSLRLELKVEDKYMVQKLTNCLGSNLPVKEYYTEKRMKLYPEKYKKPKHNAYNEFHSPQIFKDLNKYGIVQNKVHKLKEVPKNLPPYLIRHYIRGYFDGDGTVYISNLKRGYSKITFGFYGTHDFLNSIKELLCKEVSVSSLVQVYDQKNFDVSMLLYGKEKDNKAFYHYIYDDATIFLIRKKKKFIDYFNTI